MKDEHRRLNEQHSIFDTGHHASDVVAKQNVNIVCLVFIKGRDINLFFSAKYSL